MALSWLYAQPAYSELCYAADDIGLGGIYNVPSNPNADDDSSTNILRRGLDKSKQVASWVDTGLVVDGSNGSPQLTFYVEGGWSPWGTSFPPPINTCTNVSPCVAGTSGGICANGGITVSSNTSSNGSFQACTLQGSSSYGLYGLISLVPSTDPNDSMFWDQLPPNLFRTFQIVPNPQTGFVTVNSTSSCVVHSGSSTPVCTTDPQMQTGKLYLKIMDGYYEDNQGSYRVYVSSGAVYGKGFIESAIEALQSNITNAGNVIMSAINKDTSFVAITRAMLLLYIVMSGVMFSMGLIQAHISELIKWLFKIGIIATVLSPGSWTFFDFYIFSFIQEGFNAFATAVLNATQDPSNPMMASFAVPTGQSPLSVYDKIVTSIVSPALNAKIWGMLFYKYWICYIPIIYIALFFIILAIIKTIMIYMVAIINLSILTALFPFFIVMILFNITKSYFDTWMKAFITSAMTIMLIFASIALIMTILFGLLQTICNFEVCYKTIWRIWSGVDGGFEIKFWYPTVDSDVAISINVLNVAALAIIAMIFTKFTEQIPTIAENIGGGSFGSGAVNSSGTGLAQLGGGMKKRAQQRKWKEGQARKKERRRRNQM